MNKLTAIAVLALFLNISPAYSQEVDVSSVVLTTSAADIQKAAVSEKHIGVDKVQPLDYEGTGDIDVEYAVEVGKPADNMPVLETNPSGPIKSTSISKPQGLTDTLAEAAPKVEEEKKDDTKTSEEKTPTWIDKLTSKAKSASSGSEEGLETLIEKSKAVADKKSNASVFDISGLMLRMSTAQIESTMQTRGYKKIMERTEVPNFIKWRNEERCRARGVIGYERLANCVLQMAQKDNHEYIDVMNFAKYDTQEEVSVRFTSNFTGNKAYKIAYKSMAANVTGNSQKAIYIRNVKIYDFWKKVSQKYGAPDDKETVKWGLGANKPYMQAATGALLLEDPMLRELDYTRMSREDQRYMNTNMYNF